MQPKRVWVTGAGGLIGSWFIKTSPKGTQTVALSRPDLDLTDGAAVRERFKHERPDIVVHCAAMSRSPACEANPDLARKVNVEVTRQLSELLESARLVFFSTDLVFDGARGNYTEDAAPHPLGVYAETKAEAERVVLQGANHVIIRTSLNGGPSPTRDRGFNEQMLNAWRAGRSLRLFFDEFRSPISAEVTARATWELALNAPAGIYHVAGAERLSRLRIGELLAARWPDVNPTIETTSLKEYKGAPRAPDTSLNCDKAQGFLSFPLPRFSEWLETQPPGTF